MCGIAGEMALHGGEADLRLVEAMGEAIRHRGPDGKGLYLSSDRTVALAHRRLAILGLGEGGAQPMTSEDGSHALVFNGEIYNYRELRANLQTAGFAFRGDSDTEVILQGYRLWGDEVVSRLRGMFAFGLWDAAQHRLVLARDRVGVKPLFIHSGKDAVRFCSEIDPLQQQSRVSRINRHALGLFLRYRHIPGSETIWEGVECLAPGEIWTIASDSGRLEKRRYWDLIEMASKPALNVSEEVCCEAFRECAADAMHIHTRSDVPIGVLLSGGLDSSAVLALAAKEQDSLPLSTFSMGFGADRNELPIARTSATRYGTLHHEFQTEVTGLEEALQLLGKTYGNPLADSSSIPFMQLAQHTANHVKVVLGGDGGDELFDGYKWYSAFRAIGKLPRVPLAGVLASLASMSPTIDLLARALEKGGQDRLDVLHGVVYSERDVCGLLGGAVGDTRATGFHADVPSYSRARVYDLMTFTVASILYKVDVASMAYGLEVRVPLLDHKLLEFALTLPPKFLHARGQGKIALRRCFRGEVTDEVLRGGKQGFSLPLRRWSREVELLARRELNGGTAVSSGLISAKAVDDVLKSRSAKKVGQLWTLLVLEYWLKAREGWQ